MGKVSVLEELNSEDKNEIESAKFWFFPCNLQYYDVYGAFNEFDKLFWRQNLKNIKIGDKVFIYISKPESKLSFYCDVIDTNVSSDKALAIDDSRYYYDRENEDKKHCKYVKLRLISKINDNRYNLVQLNNNGVKGNIQSQREIKGEVLDFILKNMDEDRILSVADNKSYLSHIDILNNIFKMNYKRHQKATKKLNDDTIIWFPKIIKDKQGKVKENKSKWKNNYNEDCSIVTTIPNEPRRLESIDYERIYLIFIMFNEHNYKFVGAFKIDKNESNEYNHVRYRVSTRVKLYGNPVSNIELVQDNNIDLYEETIISTNDILGIENIFPSYSPEEKKIAKEGITKSFSRNAIKSKQELLRSEFKCFFDSNHETFITNNGNQFMEAHHIIPLSAHEQFEYNLDVDANIVSLCPNCHRKLHFGRDIKIELKKLYDLRKDKLIRSGINISFEKLLDLYRQR